MGKCRCYNCDCNALHKDEVEKAKKHMCDERVLVFMADFYKTLADSTRLSILSLLLDKELCVCDISVALNMTKSAISHQLSNLKRVNLVKSEKRGKEVWYSLADRHVEDVIRVSEEHVLEIIDEN